MDNQIRDEQGLESCLGKTPGPVRLKVIDHLDDGARQWIASSTLLCAAFGDGGGAAVTLGGGLSVARVHAPDQLKIATETLDDPGLAHVGKGFGGLFIAPGIGETLRVNGKVLAVGNDTVTIAVAECYVHCAKALIRSAFWDATPIDDVPEDALSLLRASRFVALATADSQGRADLSPKGDPAGAMIRMEDGVAWFADRPGNRLADSLRNIIAQPKMALTALVPGSTRVATLTGTARIISDEQARTKFAVKGKIPSLAIRVDQCDLQVRDSQAIARAQLWPLRQRAEHIKPAEVLVAHMKLSKERGLQSRLAKLAVSVPGLLQKGLESDYKKNLY